MTLFACMVSQIGFRWRSDVNYHKEKLHETRVSKRQREARNANEARIKILEEHNLPNNYKNRLLLRLWEELGDISNRKCIYSGKQIGFSELFSQDIDIDHILPFSKTLDDSISNKIVCFAKYNKIKGNKTPYEAFSSSDDWENIIQRVNSKKPSEQKDLYCLSDGKRWRFLENAMDVWNNKHSFLNRQIPEMQYITRVALAYLKPITISGDVVTIPGQLTALLRRQWGLEKNSKKNRDDHRHHAVDAAVAGAITRGLYSNQLSSMGQNENQIFPPYPDFRKDVLSNIKKIVVSHKTSRSTSGQLHNETAMGILSGPNEKGIITTSHRVPITSLTTEKKISEVVSPYIKSLLVNLYEEHKNNPSAFKDKLGKISIQNKSVKEKFIHNVKIMRDF